MSATRPDRNRSTPWLLIALVGMGMAIGCGTQSPKGNGSEKTGSEQPSGMKVLDTEYWEVEKLRLDRMVLAECHFKMIGESDSFERAAVRKLYSRVESMNAKMVEKESAFVLKHKVDIKQYRDEFNRRHPLTEVLYKEPLPVAVEAVKEVAAEMGGTKDATDAKVAAVEAAATTKLRSRPTYKSLAAELE